MDIAKRNHYLPKFYLSSFAQNNESGILWVYYKGKKIPRPQTPINTGIEKHLYNVTKPDGSVDDSIEKELLSPIEGKVSLIIRGLIADKIRLSDYDIPDLALFLSFMATRIPRSIQLATSIYMLKGLVNKPEELQRIIEEARQEGIIGNDMTVEIFQDHLNELEERYEISFDRKYATGLSLMTSTAVLKELMNMNWCLCRAPSNMYFITSDCPLVCFVLNDDGTAIFQGGFALPNAEITFPFSPTKCLYLDRKHTHRYRAISKKILKEINRRTAWAAERFIISHTKNKYIEDLNNWASESRDSPIMDRKKLFKEFSRRDILKNNSA
jgi:hypothetical protein